MLFRAWAARGLCALVLTSLAACGGGGSSTEVESSATPSGLDAQRGVTVAAVPATHSLTVRARADLFDGVGALMRVQVGGELLGRVFVNAASDTDYSFTTSTDLAGAKVEIGFENDRATPSQDRNLYVVSVRADGLNVPATQGTRVDAGSGMALPDAQMLWSNGTVVIDLPAASPRTTGSGAHAYVVTAHADLFDGVGARMELKLGGVIVGSLIVDTTSDAEYTFRADVPPAGARVDIAFTNDRATPTQDRNLYLRSIRVGGQTLQAVEGSFDSRFGARVQGQVLLWSNAALRLDFPGDTALSAPEKVAAVRAAHDILARTAEVFPWMLAPFANPLDGSPEMGAVLPAATVCPGGGRSFVWVNGTPVPIGTALPIAEVALPGGVSERVRRLSDVYVEYRACVRGDTTLQGRSEALDLEDHYPQFFSTTLSDKAYTQDLQLDRRRAGVTERLDGRIRTTWQASARGAGRDLQQELIGFRKLNANGTPAWKAVSGRIARSSGLGFTGTAFSLTASAVSFELGGKTYVLDGSVTRTLPLPPVVTLSVQDARGQVVGTLAWDGVEAPEPDSLFATPAYGVGLRVWVEGIGYSGAPN